MGYFPVPGGGSGTGHTHANKAVLDALTSAGSGAVITAAEREKLNAPFVPPPEAAGLWDGAPPESVDEAASQLAVILARHTGRTS